MAIPNERNLGGSMENHPLPTGGVHRQSESAIKSQSTPGGEVRRSDYANVYRRANVPPAKPYRDLQD